MMNVIRKCDIAAMIRRDEEERRARKRLADALEVDTLEQIVRDLFQVVKEITAASLMYVDFRPEVHVDAYDGLEDFRVRLANQGIDVEWRDILLNEMSGLYGKGND